MRRRVWCEFLPPEELGQRSTAALLLRFGVEPIVALPPAAETPAMGAALAALSRAGVRLGVWPLLSDEDGYWPSEHNAVLFRRRVEQALGFVERAGARVSTVAIDLEPPLAVSARLVQGGGLSRLAYVARQLFELSHPQRLRLEWTAGQVYTSLAAWLRGRGVESLAAVIPALALDLPRRSRLWQGLLATPLSPLIDVCSPMLYTTLLARLLPSGSPEAARVLLYELGRRTVAARGAARSSLSLGLVQPGKLGDEPHYPDPSELGRDVAYALGAGATDLALFSLEGVIRRGPEAWLSAYTRAEPAVPPPSARTRALGLALASLEALGTLRT